MPVPARSPRPGAAPPRAVCGRCAARWPDHTPKPTLRRAGSAGRRSGAQRKACAPIPACGTGTAGKRLTLPGLVAAVRDDAGHIVGVHKTFLDPARPARARVESPRQSRGAVHGIGVRLGKPAPGGDLLVGEGIETVLSLRMAFPDLPAVAALSAGSLATLNLPWTPGAAADRCRQGQTGPALRPNPDAEGPRGRDHRRGAAAQGG